MIQTKLQKEIPINDDDSRAIFEFFVRLHFDALLKMRLLAQQPDDAIFVPLAERIQRLLHIWASAHFM